MAIRLTYFNLKARGECTRMILAYHRQKFEDRRIAGPVWKTMKSEGFAEFNQLPVLEIDGLKLVQSRDINRYLCQKFGYYPKDMNTVYAVESLCSLRNDIYSAYLPHLVKKNTEEFLKVVDSKLPGWVQMIERRLLSNNKGQGFFVGDGPTLADFDIFQLIHDHHYSNDEEKAKFGPLFDTHAPKLKSFIERFVESSESLKSYINNRPTTTF